MAERSASTEQAIFLFQSMLLEDEGFMKEVRSYIAAGIGAAAAISRVGNRYADQLANMADNPYMQLQERGCHQPYANIRATGPWSGWRWTIRDPGCGYPDAQRPVQRTFRHDPWASSPPKAAARPWQPSLPGLHEHPRRGAGRTGFFWIVDGDARPPPDPGCHQREALDLTRRTSRP